jgi:hypothetical protein
MYVIVNLAVDMFFCVFLIPVLSVSSFGLHHGGYRYEIHLLSVRKGVHFVLSFVHFVEEDFQHCMEQSKYSHKTKTQSESENVILPHFMV